MTSPSYLPSDFDYRHYIFPRMTQIIFRDHIQKGRIYWDNARKQFVLNPYESPHNIAALRFYIRGGGEVVKPLDN